jgi:hypothetical protein
MSTVPQPDQTAATDAPADNCNLQSGNHGTVESNPELARDRTYEPGDVQVVQTGGSTAGGDSDE